MRWSGRSAPCSGRDRGGAVASRGRAWPSLYSPGDVEPRLLRHRHPGPVPVRRRGIGGVALALGRPSPAGGRPPGAIGPDAPTPRWRSGVGRADGARASRRARGGTGGGSRERVAVDPRLLQRRLRVPWWLPAGGTRHDGGAVQRGDLPAFDPGAVPVGGAAALRGSHLLRHVPLALPPVHLHRQCEDRPHRLPAVRGAGRRHARRRHGVLLRDRTADPTGESPARLASLGPHAGRRAGDGRRAGGRHERPRGGGTGADRPADLGLRHRTSGQGTGGRRFHRTDPRHRPQRTRP